MKQVEKSALFEAQFLEYRVSCLSRTVVLDFSRADAADLSARMGGALELELRANCFFGPAAQHVKRCLSTPLPATSSLMFFNLKHA